MKEYNVAKNIQKIVYTSYGTQCEWHLLRRYSYFTMIYWRHCIDIAFSMVAHCLDSVKFRCWVNVLYFFMTIGPLMGYYGCYLIVYFSSLGWWNWRRVLLGSRKVLSSATLGFSLYNKRYISEPNVSLRRTLRKPSLR